MNQFHAFFPPFFSFKFFDDIFSRLFGWGVLAKNLGLVFTQILSIN